MDMKYKVAVLCLLIAPVLAGGCTASEERPTSTPTQEPTPVEPTTAPVEEQEPSEDVAVESCPPMDAETRAEMDSIESQVITLRGLQATTTVARILLTQDQLRQRVVDEFLADYSEAEADDDVLVLSLFGLLPEDFDMWNFYADLLTEQIAGFYDDTTKEMAVICGSGFGAMERITYAHEFDHALQDQNYDLEEGLGYDDELCDLDSERCAGIQALIEGDATLLQEQWMGTYATQEDLLEAMDYINNLDTPVYDSAPRFLRQDFLFPYQAGENFVQTIFRNGGGSWAAVDAVYQNPPSSTEQILHPERYPNDDPIKLVVPDALDVLGGGWRLVDDDTLGEWYTQLVLNEYIPKAEAASAAAGWGGDVYRVYHNDSSGEDVLLLVAQWDTIKDVQEFSAAFVTYAEARFGERSSTSNFTSTWETSDLYVYFERNSNQVLWIIAPDSDTADAVREAVSLPAAQE